jgi:probable phosphoglycerate mutase
MTERSEVRPETDAEPCDDGNAEKKQPPKPPARIVLVRHAVTAETGPVLSGRRPGIPLSEKGQEQAERVAARLADLPVAAVYASPVQRCQETARAIAQRHGLDVVTNDGLEEADYGEWTGQKLADLAKTPLWRVVQARPSMARFPGGESMRAMQSRAVDAVEQIVAAHPHELVVAVSHADVIRLVVAQFAGVHLDLFQRLWVSPASVTALAFDGPGVGIVKLNDHGTLDELLPPKPEAESADAAPGGTQGAPADA